MSRNVPFGAFLRRVKGIYREREISLDVYIYISPRWKPTRQILANRHYVHITSCLWWLQNFLSGNRGTDLYLYEQEWKSGVCVKIWFYFASCRWLNYKSCIGETEILGKATRPKQCIRNEEIKNQTESVKVSSLHVPPKSIQQTSSSCVYDLFSPLRATTSLSPSHISLLSHSNLSPCHGEQAARFVRVWGSVIFRRGSILSVRYPVPITNSVEKAREGDVVTIRYTLGDLRMQQIQISEIWHLF